MLEKFYITTPIYYSNDVPHIGHTGTTLFADIIARHHRLTGKQVLFLTGLDEHGEKVALAAEKMGKDPTTFVDELAIQWQEYWNQLNISQDIFMRTTLPGHTKVVHELLTKLKDKGDIYKGLYKGIYCVGCEEFKSEKDLVDGKCPEHRPDQIEYKEEENYFFRLSKYIPTVKKYLEDGTLPLIPENKKKEMLSRLEDEISDLSISRQNVKWGIPLPWDSSQTTYVWAEALMNYYSALEIWNKQDFWPANVHTLGKGNNWFHSVIWPALLLALEIELPKEIYVHGYYNVEGQKMGKSLGNVISPKELIAKYGVDGTRYLLAASMPYASDSDVSYKWFDEKYNSDLANGLGNLISRVAKLADTPKKAKEYGDLIKSNDVIAKAYEEFRLHDVVAEIQKLVNEANEYLNKEAPWKKEGEEQTAILQKVVEDILVIGVLLDPIIPETASIIKDIFASEGTSTVKPLFLRVRPDVGSNPAHK